MQTFNHSVRYISTELAGRRSTKNYRGKDWNFPVLVEEENEVLDLKIVTELIGSSFDESDKLKCLEKYLSMVHYSGSHPLSSRQLQQILHLKLK